MNRTAWITQRHDKILAAAKRVFSRFGFERATVDTIAAEAEVAKGSIYCHFQDKEDLFRHVLEETVADDVLLALARFEPHMPAIQRLDTLLDVLLNRVVRACQCDNLVLELWAAAGRAGSDLRDSFAAADSRWRIMIKDVLEEGRQRGEFNASVDPDAAASLILSVFHGAIVSWRFSDHIDLTSLEKIKHGLLLAVSAW